MKEADQTIPNAFVTAVETIYEAAVDPARWPAALQAIAAYFDDVGAVMLWQRDDGSFGTIISPHLTEAQNDYMNNGWCRNDLRASRAIERSLWLGTDAITDQDAMTEEEITKHPYYTEFLARHGLRWCAAVNVAPDPRVLVAISVQRSKHKPPYTPAELATVSRLGRHAENALRLSIRLLDAEISAHGLGESLSRLGVGVFALDSLGRVVFKNPAGERLLGDQIRIVQGQLDIRSSPHGPTISDAVRKLAAADVTRQFADPKPFIVPRPGNERPLVVYLVPVPTGTHQYLTHVRAIAVVIDPRADDPADPALVRDILGLTLGEARVVALVATGLPPSEAAAKLGISVETARSALKRAFSKLGVSRQSELAALLTKLVMR